MFCMFSSRIHTVQYVQYVQCDLQDSAKFASSMIFERLAEPFLAFFAHSADSGISWNARCSGGEIGVATPMSRWRWELSRWMMMNDDRDMERHLNVKTCRRRDICHQLFWHDGFVWAMLWGRGVWRVWPPQRRIKSFTTESWHSSADLTFFPPFPPFRPSAFVPMAPFCIVIERWSQTTVICKGLRIFSVMSGTVPATSCMPFGSLGNRYELEATPVLLFWVDRSEPTRLMYPRPTRYLHRVRS